MNFNLEKIPRITRGDYDSLSILRAIWKGKNLSIIYPSTVSSIGGELSNYEELVLEYMYE